MATIVDRLYGEFAALLKHLDAEPSLRVTADENLRKTILLAAASYFEHAMTDHLLAWMADVSRQDPHVAEFVIKKGINRQYHALFEWEQRDAGAFTGLLGGEFKKFMKSELRSDNALSKALADFLELGEARNRLVHQDFGTFTLEKTTDEIYQLYQSAAFFVDAFPSKIRECVGCLRSRGS